MERMLLQILLEMSTSHLQISPSCFITYILYPYKCKYISNVHMLLGDSSFPVFSITGCCEGPLQPKCCWKIRSRLCCLAEAMPARWFVTHVGGGVDWWSLSRSLRQGVKEEEGQVCLSGAWSQSRRGPWEKCISPSRLSEGECTWLKWSGYQEKKIFFQEKATLVTPSD